MPNGEEKAEPGAASRDWAVLHAFGLSHRGIEVVKAEGGPEAWLALPPLELERRLKAVGAPRKRPSSGLSHELARARAAVDGLCASGAWIVSGADGAFGRLVRASSPPACFYGRGPIELLHARPQVAVVGSRRADTTWLERAAQVATDLAAKGAVVVSGGARGVDRAAHAAALEAGGSSVLIHGAPATPPRFEGTRAPGELRGLDHERLLVGTPHPPLHPHSPALFASRNRFIAALADVVVVVAAGPSSGTRYTVDAAWRLGLEIRVVMGPPEDPLAGLAHRLLYEARARPWVGADEALQAAAGRAEPTSRRSRPPARQAWLPLGEPAPPRAEPLDSERPLVSLLRARGPMSIDHIADALQVPMSSLLADLLELELDGAVTQADGMIHLR